MVAQGIRLKAQVLRKNTVITRKVDVPCLDCLKAEHLHGRNISKMLLCRRNADLLGLPLLIIIPALFMLILVHAKHLTFAGRCKTLETSCML